MQRSSTAVAKCKIKCGDEMREQGTALDTPSEAMAESSLPRQISAQDDNTTYSDIKGA
jgi:hypothetical protein